MSMSSVPGDGAETKYVTKAPPSTETVVLVCILSVIALLSFPSTDQMDGAAKPETFTRRIFPSTISLDALICIRLLFSVLCFSISTRMVLSKEGVQIHPSYLPGASKLRQNIIELKGITKMYPFTSWCWNLLGLSFALSAYTAWKVSRGGGRLDISPLLLRTTLVVWEISAPFTLLVAAVVKYAIWPMQLKQGLPTQNFKSANALLQHNANVVMAMCEVGLLGGLPVDIRHISLALLFGVIYIFFTWSIKDRLTPGKGPAFLYFFMDTTLGRSNAVAIVLLVGVLMLCYSFFAGVELWLEKSAAGLLGRVGFVVAMCLLVCRLRD